jgi:predicted Zn-dependent peptidase
MIMSPTLTRQDSQFFTHTFDSGLQLLGQRIPGVQSAAAVFWACTGTRDEPADQVGVSHFLEHMAFRRTEHFTGEEVDRTFESLGAEHNAGTWLEMTFYWARVLGENLPPTVSLLSELMRPVLDPDDFDQERNVILEEIARYQDMPTHLLFERFMQQYFGEHPLSRETLGSPETINALTVDQMRSYWRKRYGTRNQIFAVAGNFEWEAVVEQVRGLTRSWEPGETGRTFGRAQFTPASQVTQNTKFVQQQIAVGSPTVVRGDPRYYTAAILATILGDDTGSRLYWALHQTGLAEDTSASVMEFEDNGLSLVHIATEPALAAEALRVAQAEMRRVQEFDIQQDELDRAKAKLNSSVIIGGESTNERVMSLIRSWQTYGRLESLEEIREKIESVQLNNLENLLQEFPIWPQQVMTSIGPLSQAELLPKP